MNSQTVSLIKSILDSIPNMIELLREDGSIQQVTISNFETNYNTLKNAFVEELELPNAAANDSD